LTDKQFAVTQKEWMHVEKMDREKWYMLGGRFVVCTATITIVRMWAYIFFPVLTFYACWLRAWSTASGVVSIITALCIV
jgi:sterol desaturase/sphingolipid hydroxylase (fatty acid hydroxylase superfamily)